MQTYFKVILYFSVAALLMLTTLIFHTDRASSTITPRENIHIATVTSVENDSFTSKILLTMTTMAKQLNFLNTTLENVKKDLNSAQKDKNQLEHDQYRETMKSILVGNSYKSHIILDSVKPKSTVRYKMLGLVSSNVPNLERRNRIRRMWGNHTMWTVKEPWKVIFVLGGSKDVNLLKQVREESLKYNDIMLQDVKESFYKLSYKIMIGLEWAHDNFNFDFVLKCDDDIFVQVDRLVNRLVTDLKNDNFIGQSMAGQPVERSGRYGLTKLEHKRDTFDPYCSGGAFLLSCKAIGLIIPLFNWESPLKIDDAYLGSLVFKAGLKVKGIKGFDVWNNLCNYTKLMLVSHPAKLLKCMEFLQQRSLIENGKLINDTLKAIDSGNKPKPVKTTKKP